MLRKRLAVSGETFGEVLLLGGKKVIPRVMTTQPSVLLKFSEEKFWDLLACHPEIRKVILSHMAQRMQSYQAEAAHREKLVSVWERWRRG